MRMRSQQTHLSPVVRVSHIYQCVVLCQQVVPVDHVDHKLVVESILGDDELLQVVDRDRARALQEPSVWILRLQVVRSVALVVLSVFAHVVAAETDGK